MHAIQIMIIMMVMDDDLGYGGDYLAPVKS